VNPLGGARSTARRRRRGGGGARGRRMSGGNSQINAPSDIKTHLGGLDDRESNLYSSILMNEKSGLQQKGPFTHPGQKGRSLSTTRGLSVHVPESSYSLHIVFI